MISVILPTFNEISSGYLDPIMSRLARLPQAEILVIDGGSTDGTVEIVAGHGVEVLSLPGSSRAARLNLGIEQSQGEMLLLHHPRSVIEPDDIELMRTFSDADQLTWGALLISSIQTIHCCALLPGTPTIFAVTDLALCILITACFCHAPSNSPALKSLTLISLKTRNCRNCCSDSAGQ